MPSTRVRRRKTSRSASPRRKRLRTPLSGGVTVTIIGEGGYGCITSPALSCKGRPDTEFAGLASKILDKDEAIKELQEMQRLSSIDTLVSPPETANTLQARYRFGVYALGACPMPDEPSDTSAWTDTVSVYRTAHPKTRCGDKSRTMLVHLEYAQGDVKVLERLRVSDLVVVAVPWLQALKNVLLGLINMHAHGFFHFDVKPANMLWFGKSWKEPIAKLNDFGKTVHISETARLDTSAALNIPWYNYPPGVCVAYALHKLSAIALKEERVASLADRRKRQNIVTNFIEHIVFDTSVFWKHTTHKVKHLGMPETSVDEKRIAGVRGRTPVSEKKHHASLAHLRQLKPVQERLVDFIQNGEMLQMHALASLIQDEDDMQFAEAEDYHANMYGKIAAAYARGAAPDFITAKQKGMRIVPEWASPDAFLAKNILLHAQSAHEFLSLPELCASADMFGFAMSLVPFFKALTEAKKLKAASLVKEFFDKASTMKLTDTAGLRALDAIIAAAT